MAVAAVEETSTGLQAHLQKQRNKANTMTSSSYEYEESQQEIEAIGAVIIITSGNTDQDSNITLKYSGTSQIRTLLERKVFSELNCTQT